jgi:phage replication O-like protein O
MADVQLEHGHLRVANRLYEAFLDADFTATQFKILHTLVRLSFGWRRRTVTISHSELAAAAALAATGSFRASLRELIAEGVVLQLEQGSGHSKSTLAIQKDFTRWGRWAIHPDRLQRRYGVRPESNDALLTKEHASDTLPTEDGAQEEAPRAPENGQAGCPQVGTPMPPNSNGDNAELARKDSERQGQTEQRESENTRACETNQPAAPPSAELVALTREALAGLMGDVGMARVDEFIATRRSERHVGWLKEFASLVGPGSRFLPIDLDGALSDALIADRRVEGAHAIRAFCASRAAERMRDQAPGRPVGAGARPLTIAASLSRREELLAEAGEYVSRIRQLKVTNFSPSAGTTHFIPADAIKALGDDVWAAYSNAGGGGRFLALDAHGEDISFLIRDFALQLERARQPARAVAG